eukprot:scaffold2083_cov30-Tisochrysis_lutea.AAC.1
MAMEYAVTAPDPQETLATAPHCGSAPCRTTDSMVHPVALCLWHAARTTTRHYFPALRVAVFRPFGMNISA